MKIAPPNVCPEANDAVPSISRCTYAVVEAMHVREVTPTFPRNAEMPPVKPTRPRDTKEPLSEDEMMVSPNNEEPISEERMIMGDAEVNAHIERMERRIAARQRKDATRTKADTDAPTIRQGWGHANGKDDAPRGDTRRTHYIPSRSFGCTRRWQA